MIDQDSSFFDVTIYIKVLPQHYIIVPAFLNNAKDFNL